MLRPGPNLIRWAKRLPMLALPALLGGCDMVVMNPAGDIAVQQRDLILFSTGVMLLIHMTEANQDLFKQKLIN